MRSTQTKPRIFKCYGFWFLTIGWIETYKHLTWDEAMRTFNKIRFERIVTK